MTVSQAGLPLHLLERLCTAEEMRSMDNHAIQDLGLPARLLMENAGHEVAAHLQAALKQLRSTGDPNTARAPVVVCCGSGNNGGDGYVAARLLRNAGAPCVVIRCGEPRTPDAQANAQAWEQFGNTLDWLEESAACGEALRRAPALVDALFGTGLSRTLEGPVRELIAAVNAAPARVKLAVDVPSGMHADTGTILGDAVRATHTVCFQVGKVGCHQYPGTAFCGKLTVVPVSIPRAWNPKAHATYRLTAAFASELLPRRPLDGHKGTFGHLLAICGSAGMGGAAQLSGLAAAKVGTGLVTLAVPKALQDRFLAGAPELMTFAPREGAAEHFDATHAEELLAEAAHRDAVILGCGLGRAWETGALVDELVSRLRGPLLIDADGLYQLSLDPLAQREVPAILTPHPGELARLSGQTVADLANDRVGSARGLAIQWNVVLVMKGAGTVVAAPDGTVFINPTGDQGLATGGTGDVLSGVIGGFLAQGLKPLPAALLGVYMHGLARDITRPRLTSASFTAMDLVHGLNDAMRHLAV
jgi:ADP-dependent NAD(P)H-hydrate dehydratase / NAD(P)H-hydrate epimerase